jgi:redox-sensitive bicupin YhaK (pirin superfamily)
MSASRRSVTQVFDGVAASDGAGVRMTRVIASPMLDHFDPFLLLDEFRSDDPDDYIAGFPDHPHRGFETVTYMLAGSMRHGDNQGNTGLLEAGSVQWMTAGRGIVHSEMPMQEDGLMWGFQLWVNLPSKDKMTEPRYQDIAPSDVPGVLLAEGVTARVVAGTLRDIKGPVSGVVTEPLFLDIELDGARNVTVETPPEHNVFAYVYDGRVEVAGQLVKPKQIALLGKGDLLDLRSDADARLIVVGGRPLGESVARYGPFVMNTEAELRQAFIDFQSGNF